MTDKTEWLRENLPVVAGIVADVATEFGRDGFKVTFASENGHVLGKRFDGEGVKLSETLVGPLSLKPGK